MGILILLAILIPVFIIIMLISIHSRTGEQHRLLENLYDKISELQQEIKSIRKTGAVTEESIKNPVIPVRESKPAPVPVPVPEPKPEPIPEPEPEPVPEPVPVPAPQKQEPSLSLPEILSGKKVAASVNTGIPTAETAHPEKEQTDYEKFIGENIANKIGIAVLVLGISFFVKYAIDKDWIHESGRVLIGLLCGSLLIGLAHYFRNAYRSFSSVLVGGGLTVYYFSIAFAFQEYQLIGQTTAFVIMVGITAAGVLLSLYYDRLELAVLATIGGFITPFLVSTGEDHYLSLFTYIAILNTGLTVLSWFKRWPAINTIALFFTTLIYGGWLLLRLDNKTEAFPVQHALLFAILFYLLFTVMHILNILRLRSKFLYFDIVLVLSTNLLFYGAGVAILNQHEGTDFNGLLTALLGAFNLGLALLFYKWKSADRTFVFLLLGMAVSFLSLALPVQFDGNVVTMGWAAEMVVLYWLWTRTGIALLRTGSVILFAGLLGSTGYNWLMVYPGDLILPVIINKGFITGVVAATALALYQWLMGKQTAPGTEPWNAPGKFRTVVQFSAIGIAFFTGFIEIAYQFASRQPGVNAPVIYLQLYTCLFMLASWFLYQKTATLYLWMLAGTVICYAFYLLGIQSTLTYAFYLQQQHTVLPFFAHWAMIVVLLYMLYRLIRYFTVDSNEQWKEFRVTLSWLVAAAVVLLLSAEMYYMIFWGFYTNKADWPWWENLYYKAGLSILWGICSFSLMWVGMKKNYKPLRVISLTLFTITILKLFLFDIVRIPPGGKIAAFILLGVLLLSVSFMYQRLKKILLDNNRED